VFAGLDAHLVNYPVIYKSTFERSNLRLAAASSK
jgi:hypothetical protein